MLSRDWTLAGALGLVRDKLNAISLDDIQQQFLVDHLHINLCEIAKLLDVGVYQDYLVRQVVTPTLGTPFYGDFSSAVAATSYNNATNTATKAGHGLTVGTNLIYWASGAGITIGRVIATTSNTFTVNTPIAPIDAIIVATFSYVVLPAALEDAIDISSYRYDSIVKLTDSNIGLCVRKDFKSIDNVLDSPQASQNIYYFVSGDQIILKKGANASYGALTLSYTRVPIKAVDPTDYLDIRDEFINLLVNKTALAVYEKLNKTPPDSLNNAVSAKLASLVGSTQASPERQNPKTN